MQPSQYTNIAFISYKREDEEWAKWLLKKLEHYKLPTEIRKKNPELELLYVLKKKYYETYLSYNRECNTFAFCFG